MVVKLNRRKIRALRKAKAFTQEQLAEAIDISDRHIRTLESKAVDTRVSILYKISRALETPMEELMDVLPEEDPDEL